VRMAENLVHPRVLNATAGDMPGEMRLTFLISLLGITLLYLTLMQLELTSKHTRAQLKRLRRLLEADPHAGPSTTPLTTVPARPKYD
jgi:heme exporter protein C